MQWGIRLEDRLPYQIDTADSPENQPEKQPIRTDFLAKAFEV